MKITDLSTNDAKQLMMIHSRIRYDRLDNVKLLYEYMESHGYFQSGGGLLYKNALKGFIDGNNPKECIYCGNKLKEGLYMICETCNLRLIARSEGVENADTEKEAVLIKDPDNDQVRNQAINRGLENTAQVQPAKDSFADTKENEKAEHRPPFPMDFEPDSLDETMEDRMDLEASFKSAKEEKFFRKKKKIKEKKEKEKEKQEKKEQRQKELKDKALEIKTKAIGKKESNSENADMAAAINAAKNLNGITSKPNVASELNLDKDENNKGNIKKKRLPVIVACAIVIVLAVLFVNRGGLARLQYTFGEQFNKLADASKIKGENTDTVSEASAFDSESSENKKTEDSQEASDDIDKKSAEPDVKEEKVSDDEDIEEEDIEEEAVKEPKKAQSIVYEGSVDAFVFLGSDFASVEEILGESEEVDSKIDNFSKKYFTECGILVGIDDADGQIKYIDNDGKGNKGVEISIFSITPGMSYKDAKYVFSDLGIDLVDYSEESFMCMFQYQGNTEVTYEIDVMSDSEGQVSSVAARII